MSSGSSYRVSRPAIRTPTCDICKARHQKCSGTQPQCNNCDLRGLHCTYSHSINSQRRLPSAATSRATSLPSPQSSVSGDSSISKGRINALVAGPNPLLDAVFPTSNTIAYTPRFLGQLSVLFICYSTLNSDWTCVGSSLRLRRELQLRCSRRYLRYPSAAYECKLAVLIQSGGHNG